MGCSMRMEYCPYYCKVLLPAWKIPMHSCIEELHFIIGALLTRVSPSGVPLYMLPNVPGADISGGRPARCMYRRNDWAAGLMAGHARAVRLMLQSAPMPSYARFLVGVDEPAAPGSSRGEPGAPRSSRGNLRAPSSVRTRQAEQRRLPPWLITPRANIGRRFLGDAISTEPYEGLPAAIATPPSPATVEAMTELVHQVMAEEAAEQSQTPP